MSLGAPTKLELYVSVAGFERPGTGTLPAGSWTYRCYPAQTAGTQAWYYRANAGVVPSSYRFGAVARTREQFLSTAITTVGSDTVWVRIS